MKQPRKVAKINVADYPRERYSAYWAIGVTGSDEEGYRWQARILSYAPVAWMHQGKRTTERPDVPAPAFLSDAHLARQAQYEKMNSTQQAAERARQDAFRAQCAAIHAAHPQAEHLLDEALDVTTTRDQADTAAQDWVLARIEKYRRKDVNGHGVHGYALPLPLDALPWFDIARAARRGLRRLLRPLLMALAYAVATRNSMLNLVRDAIDAGAGAGLWRIYDGTRPATCGTATTLLAELTCTDPCAAGASGGVLTFSAITADASANATGTATWFRLVDSTGTCAHDGNVGTSGSDLNLNSTSIATGQQVSITSATITEGNA